MIGCLNCMALKDSIEPASKYCISSKEPCKQNINKEITELYLSDYIVILT